jgi:hypothetical protein
MQIPSQPQQQWEPHRPEFSGRSYSMGSSDLCTDWQGRVDEVLEVSVQVAQVGGVVSLGTPAEATLTAVYAMVPKPTVSDASDVEPAETMPVKGPSNAAPSLTQLWDCEDQ